MSGARSIDVDPAVVEVLLALRRVEQAAVTHDQRVAAIRATSEVFRDLVALGWQQAAIARAVGVSADVVKQRIRRLDADKSPRVRPVRSILPPAPRRPVVDRDLPVDQRSWLWAGEAALLMGVSVYTIASWRADGMLPNTDRSRPGHYRYWRGDLIAVLGRPRRGRVGICHSVSMV